MLSFFSRQADAVANAYSRYTDQASAKAIIAIMIGTACADGALEPQEKQKIARALEVNPVLRLFDKGLLMKDIQELLQQFDFDLELGLQQCMALIRQVADKADEDKRIGILAMGIAAARADGEIEPDEISFLRRAAQTLGLDPAKAGL